MTEYRNVIDRIEDDWEHGHREVNDGTGWKLAPRSDYVLNLKKFWFQQTPIQRMGAMGIVTTLDRAEEFEQLVEERPHAGWSYLGIMALTMEQEGAPAQAEEGLKWIMGAVAAELNVRKLTFDGVNAVIRAPMLGTFAAMLVLGQIERTFAKPIFAEVLKLNSWPPEVIDCVTCSGYGYREVEVGKNPECFDCWTSGEVRVPVSPRAIITEIASDPRFKPVDDSAIDEALDRIIAENPEQFEKAKENPKLVQWFVGQAMKATQGKAKAPTVIAKMQEKING